MKKNDIPEPARGKRVKHAESKDGPNKKYKTDSNHVHHHHHDNTKNIHRIRRIGGQVSAIERMIGENRYCPEILLQIKAAIAAMTALESSIFKEHLNSCVRNAFVAKDSNEIESKISELIRLLAHKA